MSKLPSELQRYLEAVREANERLVAQKRRQLDPKLHDDDMPWLATENNQMRAQIEGFEETLGADGVKALDQRLVIQKAVWHTWDDVFSAAEKMNAEIEKVLGDDG